MADKKLKPKDRFVTIPEDKQEQIIQKKLAQTSLHYLQEKYSDEQEQNPYLKNLLARQQIDLNYFRENEELSESTETVKSRYQLIYLELLEQQRKLLSGMNRRAEFDEDLIRKYLSLIDLEEFKIREKLPNDPNEPGATI